MSRLDCVNRLNIRLAELNKAEDIIRAAGDERYCLQLMKELDIK